MSSSPYRAYRVRGTALFCDRAGVWQRMNVNYVTDSPDAETAGILVLAEVDKHRGANADYDPQARWSDPPRIDDETARREALNACGFVIGSHVLRRNGTDTRVGIVRRLYTLEKRTRAGWTWTVKAAVDWPAPRRINGDGWHRSDILAISLLPATTEECARRRALNHAQRTAAVVPAHEHT